MDSYNENSNAESGGEDADAMGALLKHFDVRLDFTYAQDLNHELIVREAGLTDRDAEIYYRVQSNIEAGRHLWAGISHADYMRLKRREATFRWALMKTTSLTLRDDAKTVASGWGYLRRERMSPGAIIDFGLKLKRYSKAFKHSVRVGTPPVRFAFKHSGAELDELLQHLERMYGNLIVAEPSGGQSLRTFAWYSPKMLLKAPEPLTSGPIGISAYLEIEEPEVSHINEK